MPLHLSVLLSALGYPHVDEVLASSGGGGASAAADAAPLRTFVAWLENTKIRHYPEALRAGLNAVQAPEWPAAFAQYLSDLECPVPGDAPGDAVVHWLLAHAVALEYEDRAEELNSAAAAVAAAAAEGEPAGPGPSSGGGGAGRGTKRAAPAAGAAAAARRPRTPPQKGHAPFPDIDSPQVQQQLREVLAMLHIDGGGGAGGPVTVQQLEAAAVMLRESVLPCLTDEAARAALGAGGLAQLPLGFKTGDAAVDGAAALLRLLYIRDLRGLQSAVDEAIVSVQELTANPKTDTALGKVGR